MCSAHDARSEGYNDTHLGMLKRIEKAIREYGRGLATNQAIFRVLDINETITLEQTFLPQPR